MNSAVTQDDWKLSKCAFVGEEKITINVLIIIKIGYFNITRTGGFFAR